MNEDDRCPEDAREHVYVMNRYCGVGVCYKCGRHKGLARCYCGWAADGGDGKAQLIDMGETIDPED